ncbi:hypothetical protein Tco_0701374 [Tanacetum coccineum]
MNTWKEPIHKPLPTSKLRVNLASEIISKGLVLIKITVQPWITVLEPTRLSISHFNVRRHDKFVTLAAGLLPLAGLCLQFLSGDLPLKSDTHDNASLV